MIFIYSHVLVNSYGGKFGVQKDRMDKSAVDASYKAKLAAHASQTDAAKGFGGKYGVQRDRVDKVCLSNYYVSPIIFVACNFSPKIINAF